MLTVSLGGPRSRQDNFLILSLCCVKVNEWNRIEAGRDGREGYLRMNGQHAKGIAPSPLTTLDVDQTLYLGSLGEAQNDHYRHYEHMKSDNFKGCVRNLKANNQWYPLTVDRGWKGNTFIITNSLISS